MYLPIPNHRSIQLEAFQGIHAMTRDIPLQVEHACLQGRNSIGTVPVGVSNIRLSLIEGVFVREYRNWGHLLRK